MLIIQNGAETIGNQYIASRINAVLNSFDLTEVNGYVADLTKRPFEIIAPNGDVVYSTSTSKLLLNDDSSLNADGIEILRRFDELSATTHSINSRVVRDPKQLLEDTWYGPQRVKLAFGMIDKDYDVLLENAINKEVDDAIVNNLYQHIINLYNTRDLPNLVISGSFSKYYVDKFRSDLGAQNVTVINITRNPSTVYYRHFGVEDNEFSAPPEGAELPRTFDGTNSTKFSRGYSRSFLMGLINNATLKNLDYVTTVKYEYLVSRKKITVNGLDVALDIHKDSLRELPVPDISEETITIVNQFLSNVNDSRLGNNIPKNLFTSLGYEPLTLNQLKRQ
jgi:hypothetical protein